MDSQDELRFDGQVVIVTGAGGGLGRTYALLFASRGAKIVVNDLGGKSTGEGKDGRAADLVVNEIRNAGGTAVANYNSVEDGEAIVKTALDNFGKIDILVNNAGILRDRSFVRTSDQDWDLVQQVHLRGSFMTTRAVWPHMKKQNFGRIIMTSSMAGIYGNFGQANYSAAKLGLVGLSNTLAIEGQKYNITCNAIAPMGATRLTEGILPPDLFQELKPELVAPLVAWLCHADCDESGSLFEAGAGWYGKYRWARSGGALCRKRLAEQVTPEAVRQHWPQITSFEHSEYLESNGEAAGKLAEVLDTLRDQEEKASTSQGKASTSSIDGPLSAVGIEARSPISWDTKDVILYALGIGIRTKEENGLKFVYEGHENFCTLPTFAIVPLQSSLLGEDTIFNKIPNWNIDFTKILHGEQYVEVVTPLPPSGEGFTHVKITDVLDKGSGALVLIDGELHDKEGQVLVKSQWSIFVVGAGGFGGPRTSTNTIPLSEPPQRHPDCVTEIQTGIDQATLYRLSGDRNPLHIDPSFAAMGGFNEPILHGLCSYGMAARAVLRTFCNDDVTKFKAIKTRFAKPVLPGQTISISMWQDGSRVHFEATNKQTETVCLAGGYVDLHGNPEPVFATEETLLNNVDRALQQMVTNFNRKVADSMDAVYQWNITDRSGAVKIIYTCDFMAPSSMYKGSVRGNKPIKATITLSHEVFLDLLNGKIDPRSVLGSSQVSVSGMVMSWNHLMSPFMPQNKL